ncbi:flavodoxin domain-containing protein [Patulibacter sp. SYSU D01012]|uniref:flavodoxin domain-containing protein n=1 Tax=Patulibacter sp. SYSU D01012 TaxID=2817381 RepID=UPI001B30CFA7|nr:flavodoxin domain-containing protein [Patulibacter sp. SYSU D01012]
MLSDARPDAHDPRPFGGRDAVLVAYASKHGSAREIAERLAAGLRERGVPTGQADLEAAPDTDVAPYSRVVVVAAIHAEHHHPAAVAWLQARHAELAGRYLALVSVSLTAATGAAGDEKTARYVDALAAETGTRPDHALRVAGALRYRAYNPATRMLMRGVAGTKGLSKDTSRDHVYTDWTAVASFAAELADQVRHGAVIVG